MLYKSAYAAFTVLVRPESINYHPATGVEIGRVRALTAEFGTFGGSFTSTNPMTGSLEEHAIINGHYFDTVAAQEKLKWTDDEREAVEYAIDKLCVDQPFLVARMELEVSAAEKPWPTYDEMGAEEILNFARSLGLVQQALSYEQENKNRKVLSSQLEELLSESSPEPEPQRTEVEAITL